MSVIVNYVNRSREHLNRGYYKKQEKKIAGEWKKKRNVKIKEKQVSKKNMSWL